MFCHVKKQSSQNQADQISILRLNTVRIQKSGVWLPAFQGSQRWLNLADNLGKDRTLLNNRQLLHHTWNAWKSPSLDRFVQTIFTAYKRLQAGYKHLKAEINYLLANIYNR